MNSKIKHLPFLCVCLLLGSLISSKQSYGQTYCTPSPAPGNSNYYIDDFSTTGGTTNISNLGTGMSSGGYGDYSSQKVTVLLGDSFDFSSQFAAFNTFGATIWVDWNHDGDFDDPGEDVFNTTTYVSSISGTIAVPNTAAVGATRMRIRIHWLSSLGPTSPCNETYNSTYVGETEDYTIQVTPLAPPNNAGVDSLVNPNDSGNFCSGMQEVKVRVSNLGNNPLNSVDVDWSVDGIQQTGQSLTFSPAIDSIASSKHDTVISLGYVNFPFQAGVHIKAWTSSPNGVTDTDPTDDTLDLNVVSNMQGVTTHITPGDTAICAGKPVILDAGQQPAGCIFIWSNGAVTQGTSISQAGNYSVIVQSLEGCFAYDTITVTQRPALMAGTFGAVDNGSRRFTFTPAGEQNVTNYFWDFGDGNTLSASSNVQQHHQYGQDGTYAVTLTESNPCDTIAIAKQIYVSTVPAGISDVKGLAASLKVYPNPANDKLNISTLNQLQLQQLAIYNVLGAKVFSRSLQGSQAQISIAALPAGIYQLRIQTDKGMVDQRLEVLR
ncbi:MAG TPA: GEVED domain-containing protein [Edaphocola sp.]|nr:GEVED domain-containing protein [Edaphocola sp.]